jgi:hypothetical protein
MRMNIGKSGDSRSFFVISSLDGQACAFWLILLIEIIPGNT